MDRNKCYATSRKNMIYWNEFQWEILQKPCDGVEGLYFCTDDPNAYETKCPEYLFSCKDKTCIAQLLICNGQRDCPSGEDEEMCGFKSTNIPSQIMKLGSLINPVSEFTKAEPQKCHNMSFVCPGERCIPFSYVCDGVIHCKQGHDEFCDIVANYISQEREVILKPHTFQCLSGKTILSKYVNDLIPDCVNETDEQPFLDYLPGNPPIGKLRCDTSKNVFSLTVLF